MLCLFSEVTNDQSLLEYHYRIYYCGCALYGNIYISPIASPSDSLAEMLAFIRVRDQPQVSRTHRVANLNVLAKVSVSDWLDYGGVVLMCIVEGKGDTPY